MTGKFSYQAYVADRAFLSDYNLYQRKYVEEPRESDEVILGIVREYLLSWRDTRPAALLDIGCSTGNLLLHLKRYFPDLSLEGGDLAPSSLEVCRQTPELAGINFTNMNVMTLPKQKYDIVIANAVAVYFSWQEYEEALRSIYASLRPGGVYIAFEWLHPFAHQDLTIIETSIGHPDGLRIFFRPIPKVNALVKNCGFARTEFRPFELPIDLPFPGNDAEVVTYTRQDIDNRRMAFRGILYQPWCHVIAQKDQATAR
jgi:SAM-dependent methyltransferase